MGEKKSKKNEGGEKKNNSGEVVLKKEGGEKKNDGNLTVVLKSDFHCEGCVTKVVKAIKSVGGVEKVTCDADSKKLTVIGKVDPVMLKEKVEQKTHKNVELVSPVPKKDGKGKGGGGGDSAGGAGEEKKKQNKEKDAKENKGGGEEDKKTKEKEPPITTAVLKVHLHCQGCVQKISKIVTKCKGYKEMKIDKQKDLVTVTGSMNMKELAEMLKKHLKKEVEIVPQKKEGGDNKKEKGGDGGGENGKGGNGGGKAKGKGGEGNGEGKGKVKVEVGGGEGGFGGGEMIMNSNVGNGMQMMQQQVQFGYPYPYMYGPVYPADQFQNPYPVSVHAPQLFSDENPNACSIM